MRAALWLLLAPLACAPAAPAAYPCGAELDALERDCAARVRRDCGDAPRADCPTLAECDRLGEEQCR